MILSVTLAFLFLETAVMQNNFTNFMKKNTDEYKSSILAEQKKASVELQEKYKKDMDSFVDKISELKEEIKRSTVSGAVQLNRSKKSKR